ncbi:MAG: M3 family oligoendopeptidase [Chloroflexota bacterium]|nr:M3 family oligoendopeptidase [Chloroflexota bacterium]
MTDKALEQATGAENVVWDLSIFYTGADDPAIERDLQAVLEDAESFAQTYRGRVATLDAEEMVDALIEREALYDKGGRIQSFAYLNFATDTANPQFGALVQKITEFGAQIEQKLIFFDLEWKAVDDEVAGQLLADPTLGKYRHVLEAERRYKPYTLSEVEEQLLIDKDVTGRSAWTRFFTQLTSAMRYEVDGKKLTQSEVMKRMHDPDRSVREQAANAITASLREKSMELTYIFNVLAADKASDDKRRRYPSWISSRNLSNKAPDEVVEALVTAVTSSYELVARHYRLKRVLLGYDELFDYDRYAPLPIETAERDYTWAEARDVTQSAYSRFDARTGEIVGRFFDENWIHAALLPNKRGGAFASPTVPSAHPFVLVNFTGRTRDVMTLAHELGHGLHMYLSAEAQGITGLYTPLTTAEMASTFGEMLVFDDLVAKEPDAATRLALLAGKIEDSFATIFRQISMNRFEDKLHTSRRTEGELSTEKISELWMGTQKAMFGDSVTLRDDYGLWWSYIPHFLNTPGYVYAYSFGELLVLALFNLYQQRGADFVPQYLEVLAAGDSDYPQNILAKVGVDLSDPAFWHNGLNILRSMVEQEEALARQVYPAKFA